MSIRYLCAATYVVAIAVAAHPAKAGDYANPHLMISADHLSADIAKGGSGKNAGLVVFDVRPEADFAKGHVPGALRLGPNAVTDPDAPVAGTLKSTAELADLFSNMGVSANTKVVLYDGRGGFHAARVFWVLEYLGHRNVSLLNGGYQSWTRGNKRIGTGRGVAPARVSARFAPALTPRRFASADWIMERRNDAETRVIDVRPGKLYAKGHIPWARNIPWSQNLKKDLTMRPARELRAHFEAQGITPDRNIVVHCQNGLASAHSYFALRLLGYPRVRTYHRSWAEWGSAEDLPKAVAGGNAG